MEKDKYVNATELIKLAKKEMSAGFAYPEGKPTGDEDIYRQKWAFIVQVLENIKAANVAEVFRCEQCSKSMEHPKGRWCKIHQTVVQNSDYCSWGTKR